MAFVTTLKSGAGVQIDEVIVRFRQKKGRIVVIVEAPPEAKIGMVACELNLSRRAEHPQEPLKN